MPHHHTWRRVTHLMLHLPDRDGWEPTLHIREYACCGYALAMHGDEHPTRHTSRVTSWDAWTKDGLHSAHTPGTPIKWATP